MRDNIFVVPCWGGGEVVRKVIYEKLTKTVSYVGEILGSLIYYNEYANVRRYPKTNRTAMGFNPGNHPWRVRHLRHAGTLQAMRVFH